MLVACKLLRFKNFEFYKFKFKGKILVVIKAESESLFLDCKL